MANELANAVAAVQDVVGAITGIRGAPDTPPDQINVFPFSVAYPTNGSWRRTRPGTREGVQKIAVEIHFSRTGLARDVAEALPFGDTVAEALLGNLTLAGTVFDLNSIDWTFGPMKWGGIDTLGWRFLLAVHMEADP